MQGNGFAGGWTTHEKRPGDGREKGAEGLRGFSQIKTGVIVL